MNINDLIKETERYLNNNISEHNRSLALMLLNELKKLQIDENYLVPGAVMRSIMDSFDLSSDYWKNHFSKFWNNNLDKFKNPYE
jgi:hypothetical protein